MRIDQSQRDHQLIDSTRAVWQERYDQKLTDEDAKEIIGNVVGFFDTLARWKREMERRRAKK